MRVIIKEILKQSKMTLPLYLSIVSSTVFILHHVQAGKPSTASVCLKDSNRLLKDSKINKNKLSKLEQSIHLFIQKCLLGMSCMQILLLKMFHSLELWSIPSASSIYVLSTIICGSQHTQYHPMLECLINVFPHPSLVHLPLPFKSILRSVAQAGLELSCVVQAGLQ